MTEWGVVTVIVVLVGIIGTFCGFAWELGRELQNNTDATRNQTAVLNKLESENKQEHKEFREQIGDHETRITVLEHK